MSDPHPVHARLLAALVAAGCGRVGFSAPGGAVDAPGAPRPDGASVDAGTPDATPVLPAFGPFGPPTRLTMQSSAVRDVGPTLSPDGLELLWVSQRAGGPGSPDVWRAGRMRPGDAFEAATLATDLSTPGTEADITHGSDGLRLYLESPPLTFVEATRAALDGAWGPRAPIGLTGYQGPDLALGDLRLIADAAGELHEFTRASTASAWSPLRTLDELDAAAPHAWASLREDGLEVFWESDPPALSLGIYHALRPSLAEPFGPTARVALPGLDTAACGDPDISPDGRTLVFCCNVSDGQEFDLYVATRQPL